MAFTTLRFGSGQRHADVVTPAAQASVDAVVVVAGSALDASLFGAVSYTLENSGSQTIDVLVFRANKLDFSDEAQDGSDITIVAAAFDIFAAVNPPFRFYRLKVNSAASGLHGEITAVGVAR